jgi:hypothetical protein
VVLLLMATVKLLLARVGVRQIHTVKLFAVIHPGVVLPLMAMVRLLLAKVNV